VGALAGLPRSVITPVATGLTRVAGQLGQAGRCLSAQAAAAKPDPTTCVPLLRQAEAQDAAIAHGLISLSAYGTESPKAFEADLVAALHGN
jgi:pectin methylesterase-like acyl-CoA thioesterase